MERFLPPLALLVCLYPSVARAAGPNATDVTFNRDVRPILADHCFACHGPDKNQRKADLRLDTKEGAFADREDHRTLVPGKPAESELYRKVAAADARKRMPPAKFGKPLDARQIETIRRWIEQGAKWQDHWAWIPPKRPALPTPLSSPPSEGGDIGGVTRNAIDFFIFAELDKHGLRPAPEADRRTLIRRLSFDLTGLPPEPKDVDQFLADQAPDAYRRMVERLLASEHYGERMALYWLDLVRFADTGGYHSDNHRDIYLYRDWVINAFNKNLPFDRFTTEQLAGDLLPNPSLDQKIASGYNRLLMTTEEGGAQAKEYMAKYSADRVRNASTVWMGATMGCSECHDHKFDPYTMKDFYSFASFFADIQEIPVGRQQQTPLPSPDQASRLGTLNEQIAPLQKTLDEARAKWEEGLRLTDLRRVPKNVLDALLAEPAKRTAAQQKTLESFYRTATPQLESNRKKLADLQRQKKGIEEAIPTTLVAMSGPPRTMRILPRGNWLDDSGPVVTPAVPGFLSPLGVKDRRPTRLDLAKWFVSPDHPLVARVFVNRLWKLMFGQGIVKTLDDFGTQGAWPTHPDLLDWLAVEFRQSGWDVKHMLRLMALSRTYRQTSVADAELRQRDPYNQWLARQGRFRLDAEMVRDNALAVSGLLVRKVGGHSVKPYQPAGYWQFLNFPRRTYQADRGPDQYRRGLYTYWQRSFLHPSLLAFDAPSREECTVDRPRSNTPLQALVLLNDPTYVEAARAFAERMVLEGGGDAGSRIQFACRQALNRPASPAEVKLLSDLHQHHSKQYQRDPQAAQALLAVGDPPPVKDADAAELAAWTSVARVVLNLHETITRN